MKNSKLTELNSNELLKINGGSDLSDAFWWAVGVCMTALTEVHSSLGSTGGGYAGMGVHHVSEYEEEC